MDFRDILAIELKQAAKPAISNSPGKRWSRAAAHAYRSSVDRDTENYVNADPKRGGDIDYAMGAAGSMRRRATNNRARSLANSYMAEARAGTYGDDYAGVGDGRRFRASLAKYGKRLRRARR